MSEHDGSGHKEGMEIKDSGRWETHIGRETAEQILSDMCQELYQKGSRVILELALDRLNEIYDLSEQATREPDIQKAAVMLNQLEDLMERCRVPMQHRVQFLDPAQEDRNSQLEYKDGKWSVRQE